MRLEQRRQRIARARQTMVRHDVARLIEPEMGDLRQHDSLERNAIGHDAIERRDAVGGHH